MSASLARTVFRPTTSLASTPSKAHTRPRHFYRHAGRPSGSERVSHANLVAHLTVLATLVVSAQYYLSHPDALMFDHPPRSAIGWVPAKHIAQRQSLSSGTPPHSPSSPALRRSSSSTLRSRPTLFGSASATPSNSNPSRPFANLGSFAETLAGFGRRD